jgi:hypothetical protein
LSAFDPSQSRQFFIRQAPAASRRRYSITLPSQFNAWP